MRRIENQKLKEIFLTKERKNIINNAFIDIESKSARGLIEYYYYIILHKHHLTSSEMFAAIQNTASLIISLYEETGMVYDVILKFKPFLKEKLFRQIIKMDSLVVEIKNPEIHKTKLTMLYKYGILYNELDLIVTFPDSTIGMLTNYNPSIVLSQKQIEEIVNFIL